MALPIKKSTAAWRTIGDKKIYARSLWEANYGRWLQFQKERGMIYDWAHEPQTFWFNDIKRGVRSYLPDFRIERGQGSTHYWIEVKGHMDAKSATKIKRMAKYYPSEELHVVGPKWFKENSKQLRLIIPDWEVGESPVKKSVVKKKIICKKERYV